MEARSERFIGAEDCLSGYRVYDLHGEKIGRIGELFVDDLNDQNLSTSVLRRGFLI